MIKAIELTDDNFDTILKSPHPVLVDFWAEWCGPCKLIGPIVDEIAADYDQKVVVGKVNVDVNSLLPAKYGIRSIPTLLIFKNGEIVHQQIGATSKSSLTSKIDELL